MIAEVIVDILNSEVDKIFDYGILSTLDIKVGERVLVPFGNRNIEGYVINIKNSTDISEKQLKYIHTEYYELDEAIMTLNCVEKFKEHITEELADVMVMLKQIL